MKTCERCKQEKAPDEFYKQWQSPDGRRKICISCQDEINTIKNATKDDYLKLSHSKKICNMCHVEKPLTEFYKLSNGQDGRRPSCKKCSNVRKNELEKSIRSPDRAKDNVTPIADRDRQDQTVIMTFRMPVHQHEFLEIVVAKINETRNAGDAASKADIINLAIDAFLRNWY